MELPQLSNYKNLFINDIPLIDVRAPVEYSQGAFPTATNLPLMQDDERHQVGVRYREMGQGKAIELGHELINGSKKASRIHAWASFTRQYPSGALYCFRGGLRSRISQQWIYEETGVIYPRITGGYKALRHFLMEELESASQAIQPVILGGRTGTGKTSLLQQFDQHLDLEKIYQHRGSAFGKHAWPQPSQVDIENSLAITLLKRREQNGLHLLIEDEASSIGSRQVPACLMQTMQNSPLVVLEVDIRKRVDNVFKEYITESLQEFQAMFGSENGFETWAGNLQTALANIERRLGGLRYRELQGILDHAIEIHRVKGNTSHHREWIYTLLHDYYDPMYDYQLENKQHRILFRGEPEAVVEHLQQREQLA